MVIFDYMFKRNKPSIINKKIIMILFFIFISSIFSADNTTQSILQKDYSFNSAKVQYKHIASEYLLRDFLGMTSQAKIAACGFRSHHYTKAKTIIINNEKTRQDDIYLKMVSVSDNALYYNTDLRNKHCIIEAEDCKYSLNIDSTFYALESRSSGSMRDYFWILTKNSIIHYVIDFFLNTHTKIEEYELSEEISSKVTPSLMKFKLWNQSFLMEFILGAPIIYDPITKLSVTIPLPNSYANSYSCLILSPSNTYVLARRTSPDKKWIEVFKSDDYSKVVFSISNQHDVFRKPTFLPNQDDLFAVGMCGYGRSGACVYSIAQRSKLVRIYMEDAIENLSWGDNDVFYLKTSSLFGLYKVSIPSLLATYKDLNPNLHWKKLVIGQKQSQEVRKEHDQRIRWDY